MSISRIGITPIVAFLATVVAQIINLGVGAQPWKGEVLLSSTWVWTSTYLVGPVLATVAAWDGARLLPRSQATVWNARPVRRQLATRLWVASVIGATLPTLATLAWMATSFGMASTDADRSAILTVVAGVATVAAFIGTGFLLGSWWGRVYGTLAAFTLSFLAQIVSYLGSAPVLMVGGVSDSLLGMKLTWPAVISQVIGLAALLAAISYGLFARSTRRVGPVPLAVVILAVGLIPVLVFPRMGIPRFEIVSDPTAAVSCVELNSDSRTPGRGTVCIYHEHQRLDTQIIQAWGEISSAAVDAGIKDFPTLLHEMSPAAGPDDVPKGDPGTVVTFTMTKDQLDLNEGEVSVEWLASQITSPTWCAGMWGDEPPGDELWDAVEEATESLTALIRTPPGDDVAKNRDRFETAWKSLKTCPGMP